MAHTSNYDEVWIVYQSGDFVALVGSERDAEDICSMMGQWWTWRKFIAHNEERGE